MPSFADINQVLLDVEAMIGLGASFPQSRFRLVPPAADAQHYDTLWRRVEATLAQIRAAGFPLMHPNPHRSLAALWAWCWSFDDGTQQRLSRPRRMYGSFSEELRMLGEALARGADTPAEVMRDLQQSSRRTNELFTIMAISQETKAFWEEAVQPAASDAGLQAVLISEQEPEGAISEEILSSIRRSLLVLCDLSFERPNCYFEAGYAKGSFRRIVFTARQDHDPRARGQGQHRTHFDVDQLKFTFWDPNRLDAARIELVQRLRTHVLAMRS